MAKTKPISYAATDIGKHRSSNQDSGYAGYQLFFVADGMGGHAGGDIASAIASQRIALADAQHDSLQEAVSSLETGILQANEMLSATVLDHRELEGMGTTFSGMLLHEDHVVTAHIGDSRIYRVRKGQVQQITKDHTFVQKLVDLGRITPEEALIHPRRNVLMRVLGDVESEPEIDVAIHDALPGDRWMLCSDGLCGVVPEEVLEHLLVSDLDPNEMAELLIGEALEFGGPDNITVVITDLVASDRPVDYEPSANFVGSAAKEVAIEERKGTRILQLLNPRHLVEYLTPPEDDTEYARETEELLAKILSETKRKIRFRALRIIASWFLLIAVLFGMLFAGYSYTQTRYYIAEFEGKVTIFKGIKESLGPWKFSSPYLVSDLEVDELPSFPRSQVERSISAENLDEVLRILEQLEESANG